MTDDALSRLIGVNVVTSPHAPPPRPPTPGEDARRMVRHGLAGVLEWLGEPVGPAPGEPVHTVLMFGGKALTHPKTAVKMEV